MLDPNANTPPYDRALCSALAYAGCEVELATSPFLYEPLPEPTSFNVRHAFFKLLDTWAISRVEPADRRRLRRTMKAFAYPFDWMMLLWSLRKRPPDVVHVQWVGEPLLDRMCWWVLHRYGVPIVYTAHNYLPHGAEPEDAAQYARLYRAADRVITHGERTRQRIVHDFEVEPERVITAPHGPLLESEPEISRGAARQRLGIPNDVPLVLFAGLIEPYKDLSNLIDAFAIVRQRVPGAVLAITGRPNASFEPYERQLAAAGVMGSIRLDLRFVPSEILASYLCAADVVALPYREATTSGVLMTAWRFGRAVVVSAVGDLEGMVNNGVDGLIVPPGDPPALADCLIRTLTDREYAESLGRAARHRTLTELSWAEAARKTVEAYHRVLSER
jgi:glycosyltransferase involved in cell wall biosynthesis